MRSAFWKLAERLGSANATPAAVGATDALAKASSRDDIAGEASALVAAHLDAWLVDLLGADAAGVPPERVAWLREHGYLEGQISIGGLDPWALALTIGSRLGTAPPARAESMREWRLRDWEKELREAPPLPPQGPVGDVPRDAVPTASPIIPAPPLGLGDIGREAWIQARTRGAEYVRGLGNIVSEDLDTLVRETWDEAAIVAEGDRDQRLVTRETIRESTSEAVARGWAADRLASELGNKTLDWGRNWRRIAATELQAAANEGTVIAAIRLDGAETRIARIPEPDACPACRALFLDPETGRPRIFLARELVENGTNVGKPRDDWKPTVWPTHPHCRCPAQRVPRGFVFDDSWNLVPESELA